MKGDNEVEQRGSEPRKKRGRILAFLSIGGIAIGLLIALYWGTALRFKESTLDAYVNGNRVVITPQVSGVVTAIYVENTESVEEGDVLAQLDETPYRLVYEKAKNGLAEAVRNVAQRFIQVERLRADVQKKEIELRLAEKEYQRRIELVEVGGVSREEFSRLEAFFEGARLSFKEAHCALQEIEAFVQGTTVATHPNVRKMADIVREAHLNLQRCKILSPVSGYVAQKGAQLGEAVTFGQPLLEVIPLNELWVDANYKETQLSKIQVGQQVKMTSDLYGKRVVYRGKVLGIQPGTGSVFSLLPPQNATGNWIKIVQRVPVRISLDPLQLADYPLWLGVSIEASIDIRSPSQERLKGASPSTRSIRQTAVYRELKEDVERVIREIILENFAND